MARLLKSGKIAVKIGKETMEVLRLAVQQRLHFESLPDHLHYLLEEALERLEGKTCKLRKSEFFAVFQEETMQYVDIPTQLLIRQAVELEQETKLIAIPLSLEEQKSIPI